MKIYCFTNGIRRSQQWIAFISFFFIFFLSLFSRAPRTKANGSELQSKWKMKSEQQSVPSTVQRSATPRALDSAHGYLHVDCSMQDSTHTLTEIRFHIQNTRNNNNNNNNKPKKNEITCTYKLHAHRPTSSVRRTAASRASTGGVLCMHDIILHIKLITDICKVNTYKLRRIVLLNAAGTMNDCASPQSSQENETNEPLVLNSFHFLCCFVSLYQ